MPTAFMSNRSSTREKRDGEVRRSWLLKLTYRLYQNQITLKAAKLDAIRMGFNIKGQSVDRFVYELTKAVLETEMCR